MKNGKQKLTFEEFCAKGGKSRSPRKLAAVRKSLALARRKLKEMREAVQ